MLLYQLVITMGFLVLSSISFVIDCQPVHSNHFLSSQIIRSSDRVTQLPGYGCVKDLELAGTLPIRKKQTSTLNRDDARLFYWFVESRQKDPNTPLVLWLNGGPGASSLYGFFMENGPYQVTKELTLIERKHAWTNVAHYLVIDQPAGVGLSYGKKNTFTNESEAMDQLYHALLSFYDRYPELASKPLYIAGQSYAGKYIPQLAMRIISVHRVNQKINLKGILIGDGWVNPKIQQSCNAAFSYTHGLIDKNTQQQIRTIYRQCAKEIDKKFPSTHQAHRVCSKMQQVIRQKSGITNMANHYRNIEPKDRLMVEYLNQKEVRDALHVAANTPHFSVFSEIVSHILEIGEQDSVAPLYAALMERNIRVLIYNGLDDATDSNFMGTDRWLSELIWAGQAEFSKANTCVWYTNHKVAGYVKTSRELTQIKIRHAGHLAPMDQPEVVLNMLSHFIHREPYC